MITMSYLNNTVRRARVVVAVISGGLAASSGTAEAQGFRYDASNVDTAAHWAARATLANAVMFSGLGEPVSISMTTLDAILKHAGYVARPPMPDMAMIGALYAGGDPRLKQKPDFGKLKTLRWDAASFDRTLDPAAQAWVLAKITSPGFHLSYHERKEDKRIALVMLPQAEAQAQTLAKRLRNRDGLFAARRPDGTFASPLARDQAAVLWAVSNLILAATSKRDDYWHKAYRALIDPDDYRGLADAALAAVEKLPPEVADERALAIEALGRYALAADRKERRVKALALARAHADALRQSRAGSLAETGLTVYGLIEAGRLLGENAYRDAGVEVFRARLLPLWDEALGAFRSEQARETVVYTPRTLAALAAALNAMRWYGPKDLTTEADRLYPQLFETVLVRARMLLSSPLPLVPSIYLAQEPAAHFAHPEWLSPGAAGVAPVFAAEVRYKNGTWHVSDPSFRAADAMLLANMLAMRRNGLADPFLADDRLAARER